MSRHDRLMAVIEFGESRILSTLHDLCLGDRCDSAMLRASSRPHARGQLFRQARRCSGSLTPCNRCRSDRTTRGDDEALEAGLDAPRHVVVERLLLVGSRRRRLRLHINNVAAAYKACETKWRGELTEGHKTMATFKPTRSSANVEQYQTTKPQRDCQAAHHFDKSAGCA